MTDDIPTGIHPVDPMDEAAIGGVMAVMRAAFEPRFGEAWTQPQLCGSLTLPGTCLMRATRGEATIGFAMIRSIAGEAELLLLAVSPSERGAGHGTRLLAAATAVARQSGAETMFLEVREGNPALSLYLAAGFSAHHRRRDYYLGGDGSRHDAISLRKAI